MGLNIPNDGRERLISAQRHLERALVELDECRREQSEARTLAAREKTEALNRTLAERMTLAALPSISVKKDWLRAVANAVASCANTLASGKGDPRYLHEIADEIYEAAGKELEPTS
jgi:hypothetical protein